SLLVSRLCSPHYFRPSLPLSFFFFFNDPATTEIYPLSLHDALPIWEVPRAGRVDVGEREIGERLVERRDEARQVLVDVPVVERRSEEHTSELQSLTNLVCRLLLEKKKKLRTCLTREQSLETEMSKVH